MTERARKFQRLSRFDKERRMFDTVVVAYLGAQEEDRILLFPVSHPENNVVPCAELALAFRASKIIHVMVGFHCPFLTVFQCKNKVKGFR
jgi:hypothetical protein